MSLTFGLNRKCLLSKITKVFFSFLAFSKRKRVLLLGTLLSVFQERTKEVSSKSSKSIPFVDDAYGKTYRTLEGFPPSPGPRPPKF